MSLNTFKRKSVIKYGSKRSAKPPGGIWQPQGPFGAGATSRVLYESLHNYGTVGFSINGGHRNIGGVGREMKMSKSGTPYRGTYPVGWGGHYGEYASATLIGNEAMNTTGAIPNAGSKRPVVQPLLNAQIANTQALQGQYIKPSTLSTRGMLRKKYKWAYNGTYPNYWVQPNYTGNLTDSASQGQYIQNKASASTCNLKVNTPELYEGFVKCGECAQPGAYTKILYQPVSYAQYNLKLTRKCNNPSGQQKPFPFAVTTGSSLAAAGTSIRSVASACNTSPVYLSPPEWYTKTQLLQEYSSNTPSTGAYYYAPIMP